MSNKIKLVRLLVLINIWIISSCQSENSGLKELSETNFNFAIENIKRNTLSDWEETEEIFDRFLRNPKLKQQIENRIRELILKSDSLQNSLPQIKKDCPFFIQELNKSYELIDNQFYIILDSLKDRLSINKKEIQEIQLRFRKRIYPKKVNINSCIDINSSEYLYSELIRFNVAINLLINEIRAFFSTHGTRYKNFPILIPNKSSYQSGEIFKANVYVGNFTFNGIERRIIEINGQDYELNGDKIEFKEVVPREKGKRELRLIYKKENFETRELESKSSTTYEYEIN